MRTDAKIGFAIGGVLLAVLTVYAIVVPKHKKTTPGTVTLVTPPGGSGNSSSSGSSASSTNSNAPAVVAENNSLLPAPIPAMGEEPSSGNSKDGVSPPVTTPSTVTPPVANSAPNNFSKLTDDGVFHPTKPSDMGKADDSKTIVSADPVPLKMPKTSGKSGHSKKNAATPEPAEDSSAVASSDGHPYTIKSGQTLSSIASEVYGNSRFWVAIQRENKGLDANHLKVGSKIILPDISPLKPGPISTVSEEQPMMAAATLGSPDAKSYVVKSGDSLYGISKRLFGTGRKAEALYAVNREKIGPDKSRLKLGMVLALPEAPTVQLVAQRP